MTQVPYEARLSVRGFWVKLHFHHTKSTISTRKDKGLLFKICYPASEYQTLYIRTNNIINVRTYN